MFVKFEWCPVRCFFSNARENQGVEIGQRYHICTLIEDNWFDRLRVSLHLPSFFHTITNDGGKKLTVNE